MAKHNFQLVDKVLYYNDIPILRKCKIAAISTSNSITIHNVFDVKDTLIRGAKLEDFIVSGKTYTSFPEFCKETMELFFFLATSSGGGSSSIPDLQQVSEKGNSTTKILKIYETAAYTELFQGSIDLYNKSLNRKTTISNGGISVNWLQNGKSLALYPNRIFMSNSFKMTDTTITMSDDLKKAFQVLLEVDVLDEDPLSAYNNNKQ